MAQEIAKNKRENPIINSLMMPPVTLLKKAAITQARMNIIKITDTAEAITLQ